MNTAQFFYTKINHLPEQLQMEVMDFIDFLLRKQKKKIQGEKKLHPKAGCMRGTFAMRIDFEEPLEDFKDYM